MGRPSRWRSMGRSRAEWASVFDRKFDFRAKFIKRQLSQNSTERMAGLQAGTWETSVGVGALARWPKPVMLKEELGQCLAAVQWRIRMHIEPGLVDGTKIVLSYATAAAAAGYTLKLAWSAILESGLPSLLSRSLIATALVFSFFEVLPHYPVGVSEVHFIFGSTLFLLFGAAPAALGLAFGLLIQGLLFAPFDLPQYGMNVTTLLVPLFTVAALAQRIVKPNTPYVDLDYSQALKLSTAYQAGVVGWVAFWAVYGHGFEAANLVSVAQFGGAYLLVILVEPLADLAVLYMAKTMNGMTDTKLFTKRLHNAAA